MRFSVWRVIAIAMMPMLALFVGLSLANPFDQATDWTVVGAVIGGASLATWLARRYATDGGG